MTQLPLRQKSLSGVSTLQLRTRCNVNSSLPRFRFPACLSITFWGHIHVDTLPACMQVGRGTVSLADAYAHSYQEAKVPLVTPAGKHAGEVEVFFVFASKQVDLTQPNQLA